MNARTRREAIAWARAAVVTLGGLATIAGLVALGVITTWL
jgi:hypothetical protein